METIKLDLIPGKKMPSLHASQYDDGREHGIDLFENGVVYKLDGTETLTINERKGDDCICSLDVENTFADSNHIVFASTEQMCAVWGNNICELVIAKGEKTIGTLNFILEIEPSPTKGGIESESEIKNLKRQIEAITEEVIGEDYYTKTQTDEAIATAVEGKADKDTTYTKTQVDSEISRLDGRIDTKANASDVYTKSQTDNLLNDKADVTDLPDMSQYYDKSEVDDLLDDKADADNTYTKEQVDDIVYNILPDDTASGSVANFETDLALPLKSLEIDVNAVQDLHGQSNPYPAGGGANLLPFDDFFEEGWTNTLNGITATYSKGYMKVTGTSTSDNWTNVVSFNDAWRNNELSLPAGTYSISNNLTVRISENNVNYINKSGTVTYGNAIFVRGFYITVRAGETVDWNIPMMFVSGSTIPTTYAPYENICPIEGWSEIRLVQTGTNIWNGVTELGSFDTTTGEKVANNNLLRSVNPIPVKSGATYMRLIDASLGFMVFYYDKEMNFLSTEVSQYTQLAITIPSDCYYMNIAYQKAIASVSINYPSNDTSFHTYDTHGTTEVINLGGTYYGGHFTQDKAGHRQFEVTHDIISFDNINFSRSNNGGAWQSYLFYAQITDKTNGGIIKCSNYEYVVQAIASMQNEKIVAVSTNKYIYIRDDAYTTVSDFKTANANTQLVYPLATPIVIDLPDGEPINTFAGVNNFFADTGDSEVVFKSSVNDYVSAHSGGNLLGMGGVYLGGAKSGGGEEEPDEGEDTEKVKLDEPKEETKTIGDTKKLGGE